MTSVELKTNNEATPGAKPVDMKLEVVMIGVTDTDRAKAFYQNLGWRFDGDFTTGDDFRIVQMTPHNSQASIIFGKGIRSAKPGLADSLVLAEVTVVVCPAHHARDIPLLHSPTGPFS
jgi:catechol 2,3-dioxygenase-like lactoylglutathione lyase family enzyme